MRIYKAASLAVLLLAPARALVIKNPAGCSSRPCTYTLSCANALCSAGESAELQTSLDDAQRGDTILLTANQTWAGTFFGTARPGTAGYLTIETTAMDRLPAAGVRITPSHSGNLPKIMTLSSQPALVFDSAPSPPSFFRFIGIEILPDPSVNGGVSTGADLIRADQNTATDTSQLPNFIEFDRCYIHGAYAGETRNALVANARNFSLTNSYLSEIKMDGVETHAISSYNSPGPFMFRNNYLEASSIVILFGGASPSITAPMLPSDMVMQYNFFTKPLKWFSPDPDFLGVQYTNKNMLEWKIGQRADVQWNVFDQNFKGPNNDQGGQAIAFNIRVPFANSGSWARTQDINFSNNVVRKSLGTWSVLGTDPDFGNTGLTQRITIRNNLFQDIGTAWDYQHGANYQSTFGRILNGGADLVIEHNSFHTLDSQVTAGSGMAMLIDDPYLLRINNLTYRNNLVGSGAYGWKASGIGSGGATVNAMTSGTVLINNNTMPGFSSSDWNCTGGRDCSGNIFLSRAQWDNNLMAWTDVPKRNFRMRDTGSNRSPYLRASTDGKPLGADVSQLALIHNLRISPSSSAAIMSWELSEANRSIECVLEVSTSRNLMSKLGPWTVVADLDPVRFSQSDSASRPGNIVDGLRRVFVIGKDAVEQGVDRKLQPSTLYYYRLMCGGDAQLGSFRTSAPGGIRDVTLQIHPLAGSGVDNVVVQYGEKETGAPGTLASSIGPVSCANGCTVVLQGVSPRPQYTLVLYRNASNAVIRQESIEVTP